MTLTPSTGGPPVEVQATYTVIASQLTFSPASPTFSIDPSRPATALSQPLAVGDTART